MNGNGKQDKVVNKKNRKTMNKINNHMELFKTIYGPILIHGNESWVLTNNIKSEHQATELTYPREVKELTLRQ